MSYLIHDGHGAYYFRRVLPPGLRAFMPAPWNGKANWKASLATKDPAAARRAAARRLAVCMADFEEAERSRQGKPSLRCAAGQRPGTIAEDVEQDTSGNTA